MLREAKYRRPAIIVADGPSARGFTPPHEIPIFAVNGAIEWLPRANYFFTLDPSQANLCRIQDPKMGTHYYLAVDEADMHLYSGYGAHLLKRDEHRGEEPIYGTPLWWLWRWRAVPGLSEDPDVISSGNSAYGAIGLAYHMGYTDLLLVRVDGSPEPRVSGGVPNNLSHLPILIKSATEKINIQSLSGIGGTRKTTVEEWLNEVTVYSELPE